jgi:hypothetical protein
MTRASPFARITLGLGLIGLAFCIYRFETDPQAFLRGYLPACLFWAGLPLGSLALLMIHQLTGGAWGSFIRTVLQATAATMPLIVLFFLPLAMGLKHLYPWAAPDPSLTEIVRPKAAYLNIPFFQIRTAIAFALWLGLAAALGAWNAKPSEQDSHLGHRLRAWSAMGLILYGLTVTVFGIDWIMSLEPRWSSTNFGFLMMVGPMVGALAYAVITVCTLALTGDGTQRGQDEIAPRLHDLGNLLLAGLMLWSYLEFQQYLAIWYQNLPDKVSWYLRRNGDGWEWVTGIMALSYGALPFLMLLSRRFKRRPGTLRVAAALVLAGNLINAYWLTAPAYHLRPSGLGWPDLVSFVALGAAWLTAFLWLLQWRITPTGVMGHE